MLEIDDPLFQEAREIMQPGNTVREFWGEGNPNNMLMHVRAIVDDDWLVFRWWSYSRKTWQYAIRWIYFFYLLHKNGILTVTRKGKPMGDGISLEKKRG